MAHRVVCENTESDYSHYHLVGPDFRVLCSVQGGFGSTVHVYQSLFLLSDRDVVGSSVAISAKIHTRNASMGVS